MVGSPKAWQAGKEGGREERQKGQGPNQGRSPKSNINRQGKGVSPSLLKSQSKGGRQGEGSKGVVVRSRAWATQAQEVVVGKAVILGCGERGMQAVGR